MSMKVMTPNSDKPFVTNDENFEKIETPVPHFMKHLLKLMNDTKMTSETTPVNFDNFGVFYENEHIDMLNEIDMFDQDGEIYNFIDQFNSLAEKGYMKNAKNLIEGAFVKGKSFNCKLTDDHRFHVEVDGLPCDKIQFVEINKNKILTLSLSKGDRSAIFDRYIAGEDMENNYDERYIYRFSHDCKLMEKTIKTSYDGSEYVIFSKDKQK